MGKWKRVRLARAVLHEDGADDLLPLALISLLLSMARKHPQGASDSKGSNQTQDRFATICSQPW